MVFKVVVDWYNDVSQKEEKIGMFLIADCYKDAIEKLTHQFGEEDMTGCSLVQWAPEDGIIFELDNPDSEWLFNKVDKDIGSKVFW